MSSRGCVKAKWERSISIFTKQMTTVTLAVFQNAGGDEGGRCSGERVWRFRLAQSNQMPIFTQEDLASSLQLYLLVAGRSSIVFCASCILCGRCILQVLEILKKRPEDRIWRGRRAQAHLTAFPTEDGAAEPADLLLIATYGGAVHKSLPPR